MLTLKKSGLSVSSLKVHLAAITTFHQQIKGYSVFSHPATKRCLKGIVYLFPQPRQPTSTWDLNFVLKSLTRLPFELMATCLLTYLLMKTAFLVTITVAGRIGEMAALMVRSLFYSLLSRQLLSGHT